MRGLDKAPPGTTFHDKSRFTVTGGAAFLRLRCYIAVCLRRVRFGVDRRGWLGYLWSVSNTGTTQEQRKAVQITILPSVHKDIIKRAKELDSHPGRLVEWAWDVASDAVESKRKPQTESAK